MSFINYRIIEFSTALAVGILYAEWLFLPWEVLLSVIIATWLLMLYRYKVERNRFQTSLIFPVTSLLLFFLTGYAAAALHHGIYKSEESVPQEWKTSRIWNIQIADLGKSNGDFQNYFAWIRKPENHNFFERISLSIKKDSTLSEYNIGDELLVRGRLKRIQKGPNPYQFDYAKYMARKGIHYTMAVATPDVLYSKEGTGSLRKWAENLRSLLIENLGRTPLSKEVRSITQALTLGDRTAIDTDLYESYAKAGAVHILAVSGLHVGIVMLLLNSIFSFLLRFRHGRLMRTLVLVMALWSFALLSGFSPSVVRAVGMFSLLCFGTITNRPSHSINTLFLAFFSTLFLAPHWLFQPGFQMSYLAVGSILMLQPQFQKVWYPKYWGVRKLWEIFTVSLAAQLGVAPISLFYFHQFPGLFWLTNWVLLPFLAFLLIYAFVILLISNFQGVPSLIYEGYDTLIYTMNAFVRWTSYQEGFLWKTGTVSILTVILAYVLIVLFIRSDKAFIKKTLFLGFGLFSLIQGTSLQRNLKSVNQLIWFHLWGESCFTIETENHIQIFSTRPNQEEQYPIKNYLDARNKAFVSRNIIPKVFQIEETTYVVMDSMGEYPKVENAIVVLTQNPKMHFERMVETLNPQLVLADGSNYRFNVKRWAADCKKHNIPFWATEEAVYLNRLSRKNP